ncbi:hypothetical protein QFC20_000414 [Naganishia adeliensis]|uniref:Uncharacterized protein n=1 Tax=Naganishia adeliensis TaxID=92952 RepID=A0ACC2X0H8_9TREE|nr:hypothetical protein QFC20_000414 [Naganishia adeliensis]
MIVSPPNRRHAPPTTTKTVEQPLQDVGLYVIRHSARASNLLHDEASLLMEAVTLDPFHVEYRVYASGYQPSLAELQVPRQTTSPLSLGFVAPILVLLARLWIYWSAHGIAGWVNSIVSQITITHLICGTLAMLLISAVSRKTIYGKSPP